MPTAMYVITLIFCFNGVKLHLHIYPLKGKNFSDILFTSLDEEALEKIGSILKGKKLLLKEQILSFKY